MSTGPIEVAEEALKKLDELKIVDKESKDKAEALRPPRVRLSDEERRRIWEEKQAKKPVLETGVKGKVKWYSVRGKYGFISRDDEGKDVFVHQTAISKSPIIRYFLRTLADEEEVVFDVVDGDKGPEAANVTGPNGEEVKGSKYYHVLIRRRSIHKKDDEKKKSEKDEKEEKDEKKKSKKKSNKNRRPRRVNKPKKEKENGDSKEDEAEEEEESAKEEVVEKPARRRSTGSDKAAAQTKVASPKGSGDASLGAENAPTATVH